MGLYYIHHKGEERDSLILSNNKASLERYAKKNNLDFHNRLNEVNMDVVVAESDGEEVMVMEEPVDGERTKREDEEEHLEEDGLMDKISKN